MQQFQDAIRQAIQLHQTGRLAEAIAIYETLLAQRPDDAMLLVLSGGAQAEAGQSEKAVALLDRALARSPDHPIAHASRALALQTLGQLDKSLAGFDRALSLNPDLAMAHASRAEVLLALGRAGDALAGADEAVRRGPAEAPAHNVRGMALEVLDRNTEALASYDRALAIQPQFAQAHYNRGHVLKTLRRHETALTSFDQAVALDPSFAKAWSNRGVVLQDLKQLDEALASYDRALKIDPGGAETWWNKSLTLLMAGRYAEGWPLYEWRLKKNETRNNYPTHGKPSWRGAEDIKGKRLLITAEQGLGDSIQFCRYLPLVKALGAEIIFEAPESLLSFAATLDCAFTPITKGAALPDFDAVCPLMSLAFVFKTEMQAIPAAPYLRADANKVAQWQEKLGPHEKMRVGLAWSGRAEHKSDALRSIRLEEWAGLAQVTAEFHSLQKEYRGQDQDALDRSPWLHQHQDALKDFSDTAALIQCMDLVISVDTSIAHAAGAIGQPVWILLPFESDWRWMTERADSPWYPSAKLYRQDASLRWQPVTDRAIADLAAITKTH